jgi:5-methylcytosine-specific restriction protein A
MVKMLRPQLSALPQAIAAPLRMATHRRLTGAAWGRLRDAAMRRANGLCQCPDCMGHGIPRPAHEVDHIVPLWQGGTDDLENLQALHRDCHRSKTRREAADRASGARIDTPQTGP